MNDPKEEFIRLLYDINKSKGFNELTSKIISILYVEPGEISLDELAKRTGYSLSAVSTTMNMLSNSILIRRFKKPKSKKIYFYMDKDVLPYIIDTMKKILENIKTSKKKMPEIISKYKKTKASKEDLKIAEDYYRRISVIENIVKKVVKELE